MVMTQNVGNVSIKIEINDCIIIQFIKITNTIFLKTIQLPCKNRLSELIYICNGYLLKYPRKEIYGEFPIILINKKERFIC